MEYRESQAQVTEAAAEAGNSLLPIVTVLQNVGAALLQWATPALQDFSGFITGTAVPAVQDFFGFVEDTALPTLEKWAPLLIGIATFFGVLTVAMNLNNIANALLTAGYTLTSGALTAAATAQTLLNSAMLKNPITWIVALIAALVAAFIYLWNTSEEFRAFWVQLWEDLKATVDVMCQAAQMAWEALTSFLAGVPDRIAGFFSGFGAKIGSKFEEAKAQATSIGQGIADFFASIPDRIIGFFSGLGKRITDAIGSIDFPTPHITGSKNVTIAGVEMPFSLPIIEWYESGGYFANPKIVGIGDSEGGEYALPANMRSPFTRAFAQAVAADMPQPATATAGTVINNYYQIGDIDYTGDAQIERAVINLFDALERRANT